jgi:hypothetical protein
MLEQPVKPVRAMQQARIRAFICDNVADSDRATLYFSDLLKNYMVAFCGCSSGELSCFSIADSRLTRKQSGRISIADQFKGVNMNQHLLFPWRFDTA